MTFTEAAAEVLRLVGKPLHYKDITELAIEKNLLSHVGKSPEVTMGSRLAALLKKGPKENPLVRIKPGVFALRAWEETGPPGPPPEVKAAAAAAARTARGETPAKGTKAAKEALTTAKTPVEGVPVASAEALAAEPIAVDDDEPPTAPILGGGVRPARDAGEVVEAAAVSAPEFEAAPQRVPSAPSREASESGVSAENVAMGARPTLTSIDEVVTDAPSFESLPEVLTPSAAAAPPVDAAPESEAGDPEVTVDALPRKLVERGEARPPRNEARGARDEARPGRDEARGARDEARPGRDEARGARDEARPNRDEARGGRDEARPPRDEARPVRAPSPPSPSRGPTSPDEAFRANLMEAAKDLYEEEDDDDKPIFGPDADASDASGSRRRRRRRRGRGDGADAASTEPGGMPGYTVSPAYGDAPAEAPREVEAPPVSVRSPQQREPGREPRRDDRRDERRDERRGDERRDERRDERAPRPQIEGGEAGGEGDELVGRDLADLVASLLAGFDRGGGPVSLRVLVEQAQRRGKLVGEPSLVQAQVAAAVRADGLRRAAAGQRPRFRLLSGGRVAPVDWSLGLELVRLEAEMLVAVERYREASRRAFARKLSELPSHGFVELCLTVLERLGVAGLRPVRRPASAGAESHFAGVLRGPAGETRLAVIVRRDAREVGRERVADLRGSLHHYGPAAAGWVFTAGPVLSGAREEVSVAGAAPVALFDAVAIARVCEEHEIAVARTSVPLLVPDFETLDALRGGDR